jgi:hypothetical protein
MKISDEQGVAGVSETLVATLGRLLRPLVRFLISRSIPFPLASNLLRSLYVDVAVREFPVAGKVQTDSRITLLTGVHRKDVKRLRSLKQPALRAPRSAALGSRLIARWTTLPEYLDDEQRPRRLPRSAGPDGGPSFEALVRSLNTDIRPRVVLDEWLRLGIVHVDEEDRVCLDARAFVPPTGSEEMAYFFGRNLHDHVAAAVHNMLGEPNPFLERSVNYNNLSAAAVTELDELARKRGVQLLEEINARALQLQQRDSGQPGASLRINVGVYVFEEDQSATGDEETDDER